MGLVIMDAVIQSPVRGLRRSMPGIQRESLGEVGSYWHQEIMPRHFTPGNEQRYGAMQRNQVYMNEIKKDEGVGPGRYVKLQLKGKSLRWMTAFASITPLSTRCTVRMNTPTYFEKPFIGMFQDPVTGRLKQVTRQPDKVAEATAVNEPDRQAMTSVYVRNLEMRVQLKLKGP